MKGQLKDSTISLSEDTNQTSSNLCTNPIIFFAASLALIEIFKIASVIRKAASKAKRRILVERIVQFPQVTEATQISQNSRNSTIPIKRTKSLPVIKSYHDKLTRFNTFDQLYLKNLNNDDNSLKKVEKEILPNRRTSNFEIYKKLIVRELKFYIFRSSLMLAMLIIPAGLVFVFFNSPFTILSKLEALIAYFLPFYLAISDENIQHFILMCFNHNSNNYVYP